MSDAGMKLWKARYAVGLPDGSVRVEEEDFYVPQASDVRAILVRRGHSPIDIRERRKATFEWMDVKTTAWQLQLLRALRFQSSTASAGTALLSIAENEPDPQRRLAFLPARTILKAGGTFAEALRELRLFDAATMAIIVAGEKAGDIKGVISFAIEHIEERAKQMRVAMGALGWLSFDIVGVLSTIIGTHWGYIPYLKNEAMKTSTGVNGEKLRNAIAIAEWTNIAIMSLCALLIGAGCYLGYQFLVNRDKMHNVWAKVTKLLPVVGAYFRDLTLSDTCRTLARLIRGQVPLDDGFRIVRDMSLDPTVRLYWQRTIDRVLSGMTPQKAMATDPLRKVEQDQIITFTDAEAMAVVLEAIADNRALDAKGHQKKIVLIGIITLVAVFTVVTLTTIWLVWIQNESLMSGINKIRSGM